jgi:urease accessory protein
MRARARLAPEHCARTGGRGRSHVTVLRSQPPLMLRLTMPSGPEPWTADASEPARVCLAAGAAGPIGGDQLALHVNVGPGSTLILGEVSATLLLPGPHGAQSRTQVWVHVGAGATLIWLPKLVIAAHGCHHATDVRVDLDPDARLLLREELLLGRHHEQPGNLHQRLRVRRGGHPLLHQHLAIGPDAAGWDGPAVTGGHRALGSILVVDPAWTHASPAATALDDDTALLPLNGPAVLISALTADSLTLRRRLDTGLHALGAL